MLNLVHPVKADLRSEITAFGLLDWAYRKECVRAAGEEEWAVLEGHGMSIIARVGAMGIKGMSHGAINGRLDVHIDALRVDKFVYDNCTSALYGLVSLNAEKGRPVPSEISMKPAVCAPKYKDSFSQKLVMIYDHNKHAVACEVAWSGMSEAEMDKARERHEVLYRGFLALLDALPELVLEKWKVIGRGT